MGCNCGKDKSKDSDTSMKGQTKSFTLELNSGQSLTVRDRSELEARALLTRMGGGTLK